VPRLRISSIRFSGEAGESAFCGAALAMSIRDEMKRLKKIC
jgi:hypothetical protein